MRKLITLLLAVSFASGAVTAENPLSVKVLKAERVAGAAFLLFQVDNTSDQRFERTTWSCAFFDKGEPVHEESSSIENVPPRGRAIKREIQGIKGPFDNVECRFMRSTPSTYP